MIIPVELINFMILMQFREHTCKHGSKRKFYKVAAREGSIILQFASKESTNGKTTKSNRKVKVSLYLRVSFKQRPISRPDVFRD